MILNESWKCH